MKRRAFWVQTETGFRQEPAPGSVKTGVKENFLQVVEKNLFANNKGYMCRREKKSFSGMDFN